MPPRKRSRVSGATEAEAEAPVKVDDHYNDEGADLTVISSDGVHFKVHSYHLKSASPVFRTMLESCTTGLKAEVQLHDDEIEKGSVVRLLLDLACHKVVTAADFDDIHEDSVLALIPLLDKYDCASLRQMVVLLTMSPLTDGPDAINRFFFACALDDLDTAHRLLPDAAEVPWGTDFADSPSSVHGCVEGADALDLTAMSTEWLDRLPRKYFLALLRASRVRMLNNKASWQDVADEFRRQVKLQNPKPAVEGSASS